MHYIQSCKTTINAILNYVPPYGSIDMNIAESEVVAPMVAKTCGCKDRGQTISYAFVHSYHSLCLEKKEILAAEIQACERLLKYLQNESERTAVEKEISDLKMALDLVT